MLQMAELEVEELEPEVKELKEKLKMLLIPKDKDDSKNTIIEIRAGTGGDEAALFAADLYRMYSRYAETRGWKTELMSISDTGIGGIKEVVFSIQGNGVFGKLKFESGVHRVQRVPQTEASGRVHTSAATVAVLPEAGDVDVKIDDNDLKIDVFRSSGPGGQSVNTTDSAVRITHIPTNITVSCQDEKSQHKNKAKAMRILKARLLDNARMQQDKDRAQARKSQVGSGDRSERIRTYNFPQQRLTDHRIGLTLYKLNEIIEGDLDEVINQLIEADNLSKLSAQEEIL
jgi:peptide chain release factor 1